MIVRTRTPALLILSMLTTLHPVTHRRTRNSARTSGTTSGTSPRTTARRSRTRSTTRSRSLPAQRPRRSSGRTSSPSGPCTATRTARTPSGCSTMPGSSTRPTRSSSGTSRFRTRASSRRTRPRVRPTPGRHQVYASSRTARSRWARRGMCSRWWWALRRLLSLLEVLRQLAPTETGCSHLDCSNLPGTSDTPTLVYIRYYCWVVRPSAYRRGPLARICLACISNASSYGTLRAHPCALSVSIGMSNACLYLSGIVRVVH